MPISVNEAFVMSQRTFIRLYVRACMAELSHENKDLKIVIIWDLLKPLIYGL